MKIPPPLKDLIESGALAHLVTLNADGSPHVTVIWIGLDGDEIISAHLNNQQKLRNVRRDSRVVLSLEADARNAMGLTHYAVLYGHARIEEGGAPQLLQRLARVYIGPGVKFPPMADPPPGYIMRTRVERIGGVGPWSG
ncbi:MAG: PPOX class F420-dependent oxidoreductase [Chloroflexi bacterium]|nr:PPOX class F420-dependent oxidoreductase [Chloroflexota bacterium]